ncbi:hypothetical protein [Pedobacter puniceum]|uniref:Outer membrane beta-barrel protein n=1 Tax=Pedobacter puniceum TaxID=2666136 RepID=A0A7K0FLQ8_9SPHI|nr:hypothetical protein [Pedobacter puniceum]MRX46335.1 hypothetical protein [Pedobacter puniceum]
MKKTMIKMFIAVAAITSYFSLNYVQAQTTNPDGSRTRLGVGLGIGVPTKSNVADVVIAPDLRLQHDLGARTSLTLTTGYYGFIGDRKINGESFVSDLIPLKAGTKFFFGNTFYLQPEVGIAFSTKKDYQHPFVWAPSVGYANQKWDFALRYEGFEYNRNSTGMVALRAAYSFNLSK